MSVPLYMDHNVSHAVTSGVCSRGVDVITAYEDGRSEVEDTDLLDRSTELGRLLFTHDDDLLAEAAAHQRAGRAFGGVVYASQSGPPPAGRCIEDLELIAKAGDPGEFADAAEYLPL